MRNTGIIQRREIRIAAILAAVILFASRFGVAALNTGASFLRVGIGAKPASMGGAFSAAVDDINSLYYNPSGLATLTQKQVALTHAAWIGDSSFDFIGTAVPTTYGTLGLGVTRLATAVPDGRNANRNMTGGFQDSDTAYTLSFSRPAPLNFFDSGTTNLGANFKMIESQLAGYSARSYAIDLGLLHEFKSRPLSLGVSVLNIGKGMTYLSQTDNLPMTVSAGAAYRIGGALHVEMDVARDVYDQKMDVRIGSEYVLMQSFSLRLGYGGIQSQTNAAGASGLSNLSGLATGFGLNLGRTNLDYTFSPMAELGNVSRVSLGYKFGPAKSDLAETGYAQYYFPEKQDESSRLLMLRP